MAKNSKSIIQLNNAFTQKHIENARKTAQNASVKNRQLALILVIAMLAFMLPAIWIVKSYQTLQKHTALQAKLAKEATELKNQASIKKADIKKLNDSEFLAKYARTKYYYSKDGETIFAIPEFASGGIAKASENQ